MNCLLCGQMKKIECFGGKQRETAGYSCIWPAIRTQDSRRNTQNTMAHPIRVQKFSLDVMTGIIVTHTGLWLISAWMHFGFNRDPWQKEIAGRLQEFYCVKEKDSWDGVFLIDGTKLKEKALHPVAVIAANAQASLAADGPYSGECIKKFWNTPLRKGSRRYYDNFLYIFAWLALSGNLQNLEIKFRSDNSC